MMRRLLVLSVAAAGLSVAGGAASAHCYGQQSQALPQAGVCGGYHCGHECWYEQPYCFLDLDGGRNALAICRSEP